MRRVIVILIGCWVGGWATAAAAQTISYELQFFAEGMDTTTGGPVQRQALAALCPSPRPSGPAPTAPVLNPAVVVWEPADGPHAGQVCEAPLGSYPVGRYLATITQAQDGLVSDRSLPSNPFARGPRAAINIRVVR